MKDDHVAAVSDGFFLTRSLQIRMKINQQTQMRTKNTHKKGIAAKLNTAAVGKMRKKHMSLLHY